MEGWFRFVFQTFPHKEVSHFEIWVLTNLGTRPLVYVPHC